MDNSDFNIDRLLFYNSESIEKGDSEAEAYEEGKESIILEMLRMNYDVNEIAELSHKNIKEIYNDEK